MNSFETMIARYNATLPTITDGQGQELQLTDRGILLVSMKDDDGADVIVSTGEDVSGGDDRGFIGYGIDASDTAQPFSMDSAGNLFVNVAAGTISVDFTPGDDKDIGTDESGANPIAGIVTASNTFKTITSRTIPQGETWAINAFDADCDQQGWFQLVLENNSGSTYIRSLVVPENVGSNQKLFPRPRQVLGDSNTTIKIIGKCLRTNRIMDAAAGINMYKES